MSGGEGKLTQNGQPISNQKKEAKNVLFFAKHCLLIVRCKASQLRDFDSSAQSCLLEDAHNIFHNNKKISLTFV